MLAMAQMHPAAFMGMPGMGMYGMMPGMMGMFPGMGGGQGGMMPGGMMPGAMMPGQGGMMPGHPMMMGGFGPGPMMSTAGGEEGSFLCIAAHATCQRRMPWIHTMELFPTLNERRLRGSFLPTQQALKRQIPAARGAGPTRPPRRH